MSCLYIRGADVKGATVPSVRELKGATCLQTGKRKVRHDSEKPGFIGSWYFKTKYYVGAVPF